MKIRQSFTRRLFLTAVTCYGTLGLIVAPAWAQIDDQEFESGCQIIHTAIDLMKSESREESTTVQLANGAIDGMIVAVEGQKVKAGFLKHAGANASDEAVYKHLFRMYKACAERCPKIFEDHTLTYLTVQGVLHSVDDPYTVYLNPTDYRMLNEQMSGGNFGGLGVTISLDRDNNDRLTIINILKNTPSAKANLCDRDIINAIDGVPTKGKSIQEASKMLRGDPGSKVVLSIERPQPNKKGKGLLMDVTLVREIITVPTVESELKEFNGSKIGYIRLGIFGESTNYDVEKALRTLDKQGAQAYILDLRSNGGGYVSAALDVCSKFLPTGSRVVSVVERKAPEQIMYSRPNMRVQKPLTVMIDGGSASASEITAGAMKDLKRAPLVGVKSFGKGSVQKLYPQQYPKGELSAFKITTAHYHTPNGTDIHKEGIEPDYSVPLAKDATKEKDNQLDKALELTDANIKAARDAEKSAGGSPIVKAENWSTELQWLKDNIKGDGWSITKRLIERQGDRIFETLTVKMADGSTREYQFDLSQGLGL